MPLVHYLLYGSWDACGPRALGHVTASLVVVPAARDCFLAEIGQILHAVALFVILSAEHVLAAYFRGFFVSVCVFLEGEVFIVVHHLRYLESSFRSFFCPVRLSHGN